MDEVVLAGGVVMVDIVDKAGIPLASQRRKRLMRDPISKPRGTIPTSINNFLPPRKPNIGNS